MWWYFLYLISPHFRISEELVAIREEFRHIKPRVTNDQIVYNRAQGLSGWTYGKAIGYLPALEKLKHLWKEV